MGKKMPLYDCKCILGHSFEKMIKIIDRNDEFECPECGEIAQITVSPVRSKLDGTDPSWPGAYMKWERNHSRKRER